MGKWLRSRTNYVPLIYFVFSLAWVFTTDKINLAISNNLAAATTIAMIKGSLFVVISTLLIYLLLRFDERRNATLDSELKTMQSSFNSLFSQNPLPIWMYDSEDGCFLAANTAACDLYRCNLQQFLMMKLADVCAPEEYERLATEMKGESFFMHRSGPWQQVTCEKGRVIVDFFPTQVQFSGRSVIMMTLFDLRQQLQTEAELKLTASERDDYEAFSYSVSHDLRAPLRAIKGFGELIRQDYSARMEKQQKDYFEKMVQASQEMNQMIDNLLMLTRLKRSNLDVGTVDLSRLAAEVIQQLATQEPQRKVAFKAVRAAIVKADNSLMKNLLANLLENAWKYTESCDPAQIEFGSKVDNENGRVYFVKDNGVGFDPQEAADLFKPFHRTHTAGEYPGMGIGLSIAARIVERHNGRIWAEGEKGGGATFYFTLEME
jgi:signal transduction histidine kinase